MSKALEALEQLKQNNKDDTHMFDDELFDIIENALEALEIIKRELKYNVDFVENTELTAYIDGMICCLTPEEYDLLKEVLL